MACRTGCKTKDHDTYGECCRASALQVDRHSLTTDSRLEKNKDSRLNAYLDLRKSGVQPAGTTWSKIKAAEAAN